MAGLLNKPAARNGNGISRSSSRNGLALMQRMDTLKPPPPFLIAARKSWNQWQSVIIRLSIALFLIGVWQLTVGPALISFKNHDSLPLIKSRPNKYAFLTLLCDDVMAEAAMVLVHSVKQTGSPHDVIVLCMNVSNRTLEALQVLGAKIEPITDPVKYPFAITSDRLAINKPCRYSKLLMWNMVQYKKMVYLDSDLLVIDNIDELFERPQMAAVPDTLPPDKFNSGLMVVEPNRAVFRDMLNKVATTISPNVGDQGFLNSYFADWYKQSADHHLPYTYNALVRISRSPAWKHFIAPGLKVLHFSGNTKPWNMMVDRQFPTTRQFDHMWWSVYDDVYARLGRATMEKSNDTNKLPAQLSPQCRRDSMAFARGHLVKDKLSVVMNCFDRFDLMVYMVRRYAALDFVYKIYIVWGNTHITPFKPSYFNISKPIEILYSGIDSLNDRFKPIPSLETEAILMCDDDIEVKVDALRVAFERWRESPYRLVGFFPRAHYRDPKTRQLVYVLTPKQEYSIVLTKMFLMHADYLRSYTCTIPQALRDYVDYYKNCEDIAMNFLVTQLSGQPPLLMEDTTKLDYGTTSGLSSRGSHDFSRSVCMNDIEGMLGYMSLRNSSEVVTFFDRDKAIHISSRRSPARALASAFLPIFNPDEHRSSLQFMGPLHFLERHPFADVAVVPSEATQGEILCIQGNNEHRPSDTHTNRYALFSYGSIPQDAIQLSGTTFIIHSPQGFEGRFTMLNLVSGFLPWRAEHGCFGPSRVILYQDGLGKTQLEAWSAMVIKALLGQNAQAYMPPSSTTPVCLENAVVARQRDTMELDGCNPDLPTMRRTVHEFCRSLPNRGRAVHILDDTDANVRLAFVGDPSSWQKLAWFNYTSIEQTIVQECAEMGLSCQVTLVPRGDFCAVKVLGLSRADVMIGPWGDRAMDNAVFLQPGTAVLELVPASAHQDERAAAKKETLCLDLRYDQLFSHLGPEALIAWVSKQLDNLGRRGRRYREEEPTFLEQCMTRTLRY
eukprot:TRINITY_DN840_c0_g2_i1.p1 TRINITY_DN840_c0_g2~~TRINITY_DN840_c0_g2_i1.p1  ORF type:complete len:1006 (+),score=150.73 TRINITY_DN840_c0_g2_i1:961-3978(+)